MLNFVLRYCRQIIDGLTTPFVLSYRYRGLMWMLLRREIATRTSGTALGFIWPLVQPALQVLGFWFLFDVVYGMRLERGANFLSYLLTGMLPWLGLSEVLNRSANMFREFASVFRRTPFPIEILPVQLLCLPSVVYTAVLCLIAGLLFGALAVLKALVVIPLLMVWLLPLVLCCALLGLFLRDFAQGLPFILMLLLYCTPILYFPDMLPAAMRTWLWLNPFSDLMALIHAWLQGLALPLNSLWRLLGLWLLLLGPAWLLFRRSLPHVREVL
ncbi:MAG: ABC transporter permease [Pseudomonadales bacterium]|nr:ABC transporter permease [Pseudomonadales bacterium]